MSIKFVLFINKFGATRVSRYYFPATETAKKQLESQLVRKCLLKKETDVSVLETEKFRVVFRRYASLFILVGTEREQESNEVLAYELIQLLVETLDDFFQSVCEVDIINNQHYVYFILDEMINGGMLANTNKKVVLEKMLLVAESGKSV